jgi:ABC-type multidrug transport system, ATPase and permease components
MSRTPGSGMVMGRNAKDSKTTFSRFLKYFGESKYLVILVLICTIISTLCSLYGSYAISPIVNKIETVIRGEETFEIMLPSMINLLIFLGIVYLLEVILSYTTQRAMLYVSQKTVKHIRKALFDKVMVLPVSYHDRYTHGELMSSFTNDLDLVSEALNMSLATIVSNIMSMVGTIVLMFILSPYLAIISCIIIPLLSISTKNIVAYSKRFFRQQQDALGKLNGYIEEAIEGQSVLQLFNHEKESMEKFAKLNRTYRKEAQKAQFVSGLMFPLMGNLNNLNYTIIGVIGGFFSIRNLMTIGDLGAYVNLTKTLGRPINEIAMQYTTIQSALASAERIFELLDCPEEGFEPEEIVLQNVEGKVEFKDVVFGYLPEKTVLNKVSFYANPDQKIAFVGSTGAGKTTITNLISRFYEINSGEILVDGKNIREINRYSLRNYIAMVLQDTHLFTGTVMENIRYGNLYATDEECIDAAKLANAHQFIEKLEHGYNTIIDGTGGSLSQGQCQLLNIARAAVANPKILILDEATSSIDTRTERLIEKGMDRLMEGRTTFVIAHRLSTVRNSNAIMVIEHGEIIEHGGHDELIALGGRYASLYSGQSKLD